VKIIFVEGGAHLDFMDHSLHADIEMIKMMIEPPMEDSEADLDDIFDF
jgi:hypothetical protein